MTAPIATTEGKAVFENDSVVVTGIGTAWSTRARRYSIIWRVSDGAAALVASDPDDPNKLPQDAEIELLFPWPYSSTSDPQEGDDYVLQTFLGGSVILDGVAEIFALLVGAGFGRVTSGPPDPNEGRNNDFRYDPASKLLYFKVAGSWEDVAFTLTFHEQGTLAERDAFDDEAAGFTFLDNVSGNIYVKKTGTSGDWAGPFAFVGPQGSQGPPGTPGLTWNYNSSTDTGVDPGANNVRLNAASWSATTEITFSNTSLDGGVATFLTSIGASTNPVKGFVVLRRIGSTAMAIYRFTAVNSQSGRRRFTVEHVNSSGSPGGVLAATFLMAGDKGSQGDQGDVGDTGPQGPKGDNFEPLHIVAAIADRDDFDSGPVFVEVPENSGNFVRMSVLVASDSTNDDQPTLYFLLDTDPAVWSDGVTFEVSIGEVTTTAFSFVGDGVETTFDLEVPIVDANRVMWFEDGVWQQPGVHFTVSGTEVIRSEAPANGAQIFGLVKLPASTFAFGNDDWTGDPLTVENGGTGASTASGARANLAVPGLGTSETISGEWAYTAPLTLTNTSVALEIARAASNAFLRLSRDGAPAWDVDILGSGLLRFRNSGNAIFTLDPGAPDGALALGPTGNISGVGRLNAGLFRPGQVVQRVVATSTTDESTTSDSMVNSSLVGTITPLFNNSIIEVRVEVSEQLTRAAGSPSSRIAGFEIFNVTNSAVVAGEAQVSNTAASGSEAEALAFRATVSFSGDYTVNSTAARTFRLRHRVNVATNVQSRIRGDVLPSRMVLVEIRQ